MTMSANAIRSGVHRDSITGLLLGCWKEMALPIFNFIVVKPARCTGNADHRAIDVIIPTAEVDLDTNGSRPDIAWIPLPCLRIRYGCDFLTGNVFEWMGDVL